MPAVGQAGTMSRVLKSGWLWWIVSVLVFLFVTVFIPAGHSDPGCVADPARVRRRCGAGERAQRPVRRSNVTFTRDIATSRRGRPGGNDARDTQFDVYHPPGRDAGHSRRSCGSRRWLGVGRQKRSQALPDEGCPQAVSPSSPSTSRSHRRSGTARDPNSTAGAAVPVDHAAEHRIDPTKLVLAGDSTRGQPRVATVGDDYQPGFAAREVGLTPESARAAARSC